MWAHEAPQENISMPCECLLFMHFISSQWSNYKNTLFTYSFNTERVEGFDILRKKVENSQEKYSLIEEVNIWKMFTNLHICIVNVGLIFSEYLLNLRHNCFLTTMTLMHCLNETELTLL